MNKLSYRCFVCSIRLGKWSEILVAKNSSKKFWTIFSFARESSDTLKSLTKCKLYFSILTGNALLLYFSYYVSHFIFLHFFTDKEIFCHYVNFIHNSMFKMFLLVGKFWKHWMALFFLPFFPLFNFIYLFISKFLLTNVDISWN